MSATSYTASRVGAEMPDWTLCTWCIKHIEPHNVEYEHCIHLNVLQLKWKRFIKIKKNKLKDSLGQALLPVLHSAWKSAMSWLRKSFIRSLLCRCSNLIHCPLSSFRSTPADIQYSTPLRGWEQKGSYLSFDTRYSPTLARAGGKVTEDISPC